MPRKTSARPEETAKDRLLAIRLPAQLLASIDAFVERMQAEVPWATTTRSDAVRWLIMKALEQQGLPPGPAPVDQHPS